MLGHVKFWNVSAHPVLSVPMRQARVFGGIMSGSGCFKMKAFACMSFAPVGERELLRKSWAGIVLNFEYPTFTAPNKTILKNGGFAWPINCVIASIPFRKVRFTFPGD